MCTYYVPGTLCLLLEKRYGKKWSDENKALQLTATGPFLLGRCAKSWGQSIPGRGSSTGKGLEVGRGRACL